MTADDRTDDERSSGQAPIVHEGAPAEDIDGNENADDKVEILQPSGKPVPRG